MSTLAILGFRKKAESSEGSHEAVKTLSPLVNQRVKGIEPSCAAWEAAVLPLNYTRMRIFDFRLPIVIGSLKQFKSSLVRNADLRSIRLAALTRDKFCKSRTITATKSRRQMNLS